MFYKLKIPYALRGWQKLPYALSDTAKGSVQFLDKKEFDALSLCNGKIDLDGILIPEEYGRIAKVAAEKGIVETCAYGETTQAWQDYKLHPSRYIKTVHWSITGHCNYRCKHCYMSAPDAKFGELTHDQCMDLIDQMYECGIQNVTLTGGEPLVRKDFWEIVDRLLAYGIKIKTIYSNGKLVTDELLDKLDARHIKPEFNLSFDGLGWHDWMRGVPGAEEAAIDAFKRCRKRDFPIAAETTLHKSNVHTLRDTINLLGDLGVAHLKVNPAAEVGAWVENAPGNSLSIEEVYDKYLEYIPHFFEDGSPLDIMLGGMFVAKKGSKKYRVPALKFCQTEKAKDQCICGHARLTMYISADGLALPCMAVSGMEISRQYPSVVKEGLATCLSDSTYMSLIETRLGDYLDHNPGCASCEHRYTCGGGCRASALESSPEDIMGPDMATCALIKGDYPEKIKQRLATYF